MYAFLMGGMFVLLSGAIVLALSFSLATDNQTEYGLNNGTALSSTKGTQSHLLLDTYTQIKR